MICVGDIFTEKQIENKLKKEGFPVNKSESDDGNIIYLDKDDIILVVLGKYRGGVHKRVIAGYMAHFYR